MLSRITVTELYPDGTKGKQRFPRVTDIKLKTLSALISNIVSKIQPEVFGDTTLVGVSNRTDTIRHYEASEIAVYAIILDDFTVVLFKGDGEISDDVFVLDSAMAVRPEVLTVITIMKQHDKYHSIINLNGIIHKYTLTRRKKKVKCVYEESRPSVNFEYFNSVNNKLDDATLQALDAFLQTLPNSLT